MRTQYFTAASLDGFIATTDDSLEWLFPLGDINDTSYPQFIEHVGALAMGSSERLDQQAGDEHAFCAQTVGRDPQQQPTAEAASPSTL